MEEKKKRFLHIFYTKTNSSRKMCMVGAAYFAEDRGWGEKPSISLGDKILDTPIYCTKGDPKLTFL